MIKLSIGILGLVLLILPVTAKEKNQKIYPVSSISPSLMKDAFAVVRCDEHEFELIDPGKAIERVHRVVTILNKNGDTYSELYLPYDKSMRIKSITGHSYNTLGLPDDRLKNSAIEDVNYNSAGIVFDDLRLKYARIQPVSYPFTVEYQYEIEHDGLIDYPGWQPVGYFRVSVEHSSYRISRPLAMEIRYREFNLPEGTRKDKKESGNSVSEWHLDSLSAVREEAMAPMLYTQMPRVVFGPTDFIYFGSAGKMNSWKELGSWFYELNKGLNQLPEARQTEIRKIAGNETDTASIVRSLYKYMQKRTRYVGIELGLGGYQPFPAETVDRLGYGDCKGLANYMKAILDVVNIPSVCVIAGAGENPGITMDDFATDTQTNHAILCVPMKKDTIWLECTSQTYPCGFMGTFTGGKRVLLVTPEGGKLANVPKLPVSKNNQKCVAELKITPDGVIQGSAKTVFAGYEYEDIARTLTESPKDQEKGILRRLSLAGLVVNKFSYTERPDKIPEVEENMDISSSMLISKTGTRLFVPQNLLSPHVDVPTKTDDRKLPFIQRFAYMSKDSVAFQLPEGYEPESIPKEKQLKTEFGEYHVRSVFQNNKITYLRELKIFEGNWPKEKYQSLIDFYSSVASTDKNRLVLKQKL